MSRLFEDICQEHVFLIWLNRDPIKEDMTTWKDAPSPGPGA